MTVRGIGFQPVDIRRRPDRLEAYPTSIPLQAFHGGQGQRGEAGRRFGVAEFPQAEQVDVVRHEHRPVIRLAQRERYSLQRQVVYAANEEAPGGQLVVVSSNSTMAGNEGFAEGILYSDSLENPSLLPNAARHQGSDGVRSPLPAQVMPTVFPLAPREPASTGPLVGL